MRPFHSFPKIGRLVAALAVLAVAAPLRAGDNVPFEAELTVIFAGSDGNVRVFDVAGIATLMGPVTGEVRDQDRGPRSVGTLLLQGANGDTLFLSYALAEGEPGQFGGFYTVEGGTGRFAGATGGGMIIGRDVALGVFDVTLEGTISF